MITKATGKVWLMLLVFCSTLVLPACLNTAADSTKIGSGGLVIHSNDTDDTHWLLRSVTDGEESTLRTALNFFKHVDFTKSICYQSISFKILLGCITKKVAIALSKERIHLRNSVFII